MLAMGHGVLYSANRDRYQGEVLKMRVEPLDHTEKEGKHPKRAGQPSLISLADWQESAQVMRAGL